MGEMEGEEEEKNRSRRRTLKKQGDQERRWTERRASKKDILIEGVNKGDNEKHGTREISWIL